MTKDVSMRLHRIFNIIVAAFCIICGICLGVCCLFIYYKKGEYSREIVAEVFSYIRIPVYISIAFILGSFVYEFVSPLKKKKEKLERDYVFLLKKLSAKKNFAESDVSIVKAIEKERRIRILLNVVRVVIVCASGVVFLYYALNIDHFHKSEINESMIKAMIWLVPCLCVSGVYAVFYSFFEKKSMEREADLLKKIPDARGEGKARGRNCLKLIFTVIGSFLLASASYVVVFLPLLIAVFNRSFELSIEAYALLGFALDYVIWVSAVSALAIIRAIREFMGYSVEGLRKALLIVLRIGIILFALFMIAAGVLGSGFADVMTKAVNICTECIGLG